MDHNEAVLHKATERYLLDELDPEQRDQFEEHLFECQECALDVRAGAMFVEQSKLALAEHPVPVPVRAIAPAAAEPGWFSWFRPAFAAPVFALLLAVVGYQNLVQVPHLEQALNEPTVLPYGSINVSTRGTVTAQVQGSGEKGFDLLVSIPPDATYSDYILELHKPDGSLQCSLKIPASSPDDARLVHFPPSSLVQGTYKLAVSGITAAGQKSSLGSYPVDLQIQK